VLEELGLHLELGETANAVGVLVDPGPRRVDVLFACTLAADAPTPVPGHVEVSSAQWCNVDSLPDITPITAQVLAEYEALGLLGGA
jgi:hypothetical protein